MGEIGWCGIDWDTEPLTVEGREKIFLKMSEIIEERKLDNDKIVTAYTNRGNVFWIKGKLENALSDFNAALELDPDCEMAYFKRANIYYQLAKYKEAFSDVSNAIRLNSEEERLKIYETQLMERIKSKLKN